MAAAAEKTNSPRRKNQPRRAQFDGEHSGARQFLKPQRQLVRIPANPRRQRLGLVMKGQRGKIAPVGIAAEQLHAAGRKHELEQQQPQQPERDRSGLTDADCAGSCRRDAGAPVQNAATIATARKRWPEIRLRAADCPIESRENRGQPSRARDKAARARRGTARARCRPSKERPALRPQRIGNQESHPENRTSTASATSETGPDRCLAGRIAAAPPDMNWSAGKMPSWPISPLICVHNETKAMR